MHVQPALGQGPPQITTATWSWETDQGWDPLRASRSRAQTCSYPGYNTSISRLLASRAVTRNLDCFKSVCGPLLRVPWDTSTHQQLSCQLPQPKWKDTVRGTLTRGAWHEPTSTGAPLEPQPPPAPSGCSDSQSSGGRSRSPGPGQSSFQRQLPAVFVTWAPQFARPRSAVQQPTVLAFAGSAVFLRTDLGRPSTAALCLLCTERSSHPPPGGHLLVLWVPWSQCSTPVKPVPVRALTSATVMFCLAQAMMSGSLIKDFISSTVM